MGKKADASPNPARHTTAKNIQPRFFIRKTSVFQNKDILQFSIRNGRWLVKTFPEKSALDFPMDFKIHRKI